MSISMLIAGIAIVAVALNILATRAVLRSGAYDARQKTAQCALIWLVPFLGGVMAYSFATEASAERITTDLTDRVGSGDTDRSAHSAADYSGDGGGGGDGK